MWIFHPSFDTNKCWSVMVESFTVDTSQIHQALKLVFSFRHFAVVARYDEIIRENIRRLI